MHSRQILWRTEAVTKESQVVWLECATPLHLQAASLPSVNELKNQPSSRDFFPQTAVSKMALNAAANKKYFEMFIRRFRL